MQEVRVWVTGHDRFCKFLESDKFDVEGVQQYKNTIYCNFLAKLKYITSHLNCKKEFG